MTRPVLLVHGAFHRASCWDLVRRGLDEAGIANDAVELPFTGYADDLAAVSAAVESLPGDEPAVVCGHSAAGHLVSDLASTRLGHAVFLAGFMPDEGDEPLPTVLSAPPTALDLTVSEDGVFSVTPEVAMAAFYHDCDPTLAQQALAHLRATPAASMLSPPAAAPSWRRVESTYVLCAADRAFHPELQQRLAAHATTTFTIRSGHAPFLSAVDDLVDALVRCAAGG